MPASKSAVQVYYNSSRPAQLHADAYTRGNQIYLGAGQEHCLSHELGHVLQQQQRSVPITEKMNGVGVNTDERLEQGADRLGASIGSQTKLSMQASYDTNQGVSETSSSSPVQMKMSLPWKRKSQKQAASGRTAVPGQVITEGSSDAEKALMARFSGTANMTSTSNAYTQVPLPPAPAPAAVPAAAPAANVSPSRQNIMDSFAQLHAYWKANSKMPASATTGRRRPRVQAPVKPSGGRRIINFFKNLGRESGSGK